MAIACGTRGTKMGILLIFIGVTEAHWNTILSLITLDHQIYMAVMGQFVASWILCE